MKFGANYEPRCRRSCPNVRAPVCPGDETSCSGKKQRKDNRHRRTTCKHNTTKHCEEELHLVECKQNEHQKQRHKTTACLPMRTDRWMPSLPLMLLKHYFVIGEQNRRLQIARSTTDRTQQKRKVLKLRTRRLERHPNDTAYRFFFSIQSQMKCCIATLQVQKIHVHVSV